MSFFINFWIVFRGVNGIFIFNKLLYLITDVTLLLRFLYKNLYKIFNFKCEVIFEIFLTTIICGYLITYSLLFYIRKSKVSLGLNSLVLIYTRKHIYLYIIICNVYI